MRRQAIILMLVSVLVTCGLLAWALTGALRTREALALHVDHLDPAAVQTSMLYRDVLDRQTRLRGFLLTGDRGLLPGRAREQDAIRTDLTLLAGAAGATPELAAPVRDVSTAYNRWDADVVRPSITAMMAGGTTAARALASSNLARSRSGSVSALTRSLLVDLRRLRADSGDQARRASDQVLAALVGAVLLILALIVCGGLLVWRSVLSPSRKLEGALSGMAAGDYQHAVPASGPPELAALGRGAEATRQRVVEALGQQGPAVRALRDALAPVLVDVEGLTVAARLTPAEGLLAGDWIDTVVLRDGRLGLSVGDVCGHGPAAGVHALLLREQLAAALLSGSPPDRAVRCAADRLDDVEEMFATVVLAVVAPRTGMIAYVNAGHPPPFVIRRDRTEGAVPPARTAGLPPTGPLIASIFGPAARWEVGEARLEPGDTLLVYTDGITEARDGRGAQFGTDRLRIELGRRPDRPPERLIADVFDTVGRHCGRPAVDDRTAVAVTRDPCGPRPGGADEAYTAEKAYTVAAGAADTGVHGKDL